MNKQPLKISDLITLAKQFCEQESQTQNSELFGVTDGKAVGTYIEHKFKDFLLLNMIYRLVVQQVALICLRPKSIRI